MSNRLPWAAVALAAACLVVGFSGSRTCIAGASIALADRFIQPTDDAGEKKVLFSLPITPDGGLPGGKRLEAGRWHSVELAWDLEAGRCRVLIEGREAAALAQSNAHSAGVSYLRLRSTAPAADPAGFFVERVRVEVTP